MDQDLNVKWKPIKFLAANVGDLRIGDVFLDTITKAQFMRKNGQTGPY